MPDSKTTTEKKSAGIFIRNLDESVHRKFKVLCAREGVSMNEVLIAYLNTCIDNDCIVVKA